MIKTGDLVTVSGLKGTVRATALNVATPTEMPAIPGAPPVDQVREILAEKDVSQVAFIGYTTEAGEDLAFIAFFGHHLGRQTWFDLTGQLLEITPRESA
jgi:hypothetical protein